MVGREPLTNWETEALRESRSRHSSRPPVSKQRERGVRHPDTDWVTLREASEATGIPLGTIRKWARRDTIPSYLESDGEQSLRMVSMAGVRRRAQALGRSHRGEAPVQLSPSPLVEPSAPTPPAGTGADRADTMIVPIDAWNKMLNQLGNLHRAGQELAEARERAAKAETETQFLRERLAEMRQDLHEATGEAPTPAPSAQPVDDGPQEAEPEAQRFWQAVISAWKRRK